MDKGTERPTNKAFVGPMKKVSRIVTSINPMIIVFIRSVRVCLVWSDWSPVIVMCRFFGNILSSISLTTPCTLSGINKISSTALDNVKRYYILPIEAGKTLYIGKCIFHRSNVFKVKRSSTHRTQYKVTYLVHI